MRYKYSFRKVRIKGQYGRGEGGGHIPPAMNSISLTVNTHYVSKNKSAPAAMFDQVIYKN